VAKTKHKAVALHPPASPEPSTLPSANGHGTENGTENDTEPHGDASSIGERSVALLNLPDTVNLARLEKLFEPHGEVRKLQLRTDKGGAIVEFAHAATVGRARLALEGTEIDGSVIRFGSPAALLKHGEPHVKYAGAPAKGSVKADGKNAGVPAKGGALAMLPRAMPRKPGLGTQSWRNARKANNAGEPVDGGGKAKSNADFRAMLMGKESPKEASPE
jgi:RNA recognition motif-containing protein